MHITFLVKIIPFSDYEQASCYHAGPCLCKYSTKTFFGLVKTFCHENLLAVRLCFTSVNFPTQPSDSTIYNIDSWLLLIYYLCIPHAQLGYSLELLAIPRTDYCATVPQYLLTVSDTVQPPPAPVVSRLYIVSPCLPLLKPQMFPLHGGGCIIIAIISSQSSQTSICTYCWVPTANSCLIQGNLASFSNDIYS